jgi:hypothetical protein
LQRRGSCDDLVRPIGCVVLGYIRRTFWLLKVPLGFDGVDGQLPLQHNVALSPIDRIELAIVERELCPNLISERIDPERFVQEVVVEALDATSRPDPNVTDAGAT